MPSFADLLQQGIGHAWLFIPSAILLGILHGLEPGHSKTMMAAFIVAIHGTVTQAILLGLAATISHTIIVWGIALGGMYLWQGVDAERFEPYFQLASAAIIIAIALWMFWRTWQERRSDHSALSGHDHDHAHPHDHDHTHAADLRRIDTGHGTVVLEVFEDGVPPRWRLRSETGAAWAEKDVVLVTERPDGGRQAFTFANRDGYLESIDEIPEPHQFLARLSLGRGAHILDYELIFTENHGHAHVHAHAEAYAVSDTYQDAHERAHANDIRSRFAGRKASTGQIILFGLTGGLIPCPAAITILLLCLQLKQLALGAALVLCFSIGLAITLVAVGVAAALSLKYASTRSSWFAALASRAPYLSSTLIILVAFYVGFQGWIGLFHHTA